MTAENLLASLERSGIVLTAQGGRLRVEAPRGAVTAELRQLLRDRKVDLIEELTRRMGWPPESLDAERQFGVSHARLFPFIGQTVVTPSGPGRLLQVFPERAAVVLDTEPKRAAYFLPSELQPVAGVGASSLLETRVH